MKEDFLHFIWKHQLLTSPVFISETKEKVEVITPGTHNHNQGPDFSTSMIKIDGQIWVGNIEIHNTSKDWLLHKHQFDQNYNNVILHVIWDHFIPIVNAAGRVVPTIRLLPYTKDITQHNLALLIGKQSIIPCEHLVHKVDETIIKEELSANLSNRILRKSQETSYNKLDHTLKDLFGSLLFDALGANVNKEAFQLLAKRIPLKTLLKHKNNNLQVEALLFGAAGFLESKNNDPYYQALQKEWLFLRHKHQLETCTYCHWKFSRLRPFQFPTFRLAQLASLITSFEDLFQTIQSSGKLPYSYKTTTSSYWQHHFTFNKVTTQHTTHLSKSLIDMININAVALFLCIKSTLKLPQVIHLLQTIPPENNKITRVFERLSFPNTSAFQSQALKELYTQKCSQKKCLNCLIGSNALSNIK